MIDFNIENYLKYENIENLSNIFERNAEFLKEINFDSLFLNILDKEHSFKYVLEKTNFKASQISFHTSQNQDLKKPTKRKDVNQKNKK